MNIKQTIKKKKRTICNVPRDEIEEHDTRVN
mgnify:CR=1 FL=1